MSKKLLAVIIFITVLSIVFCGCRRKSDPSADAIDVIVGTEDAVPAETDAPELTAAATEPSAATEAATEPATQEPTQAPSEASTFAPTPTAEATPAATQQPTAAPTAAPTSSGGSTDYGIFADCAFVGNSVFDGLYRYAIITNSHFFTKTALNINTVYTATTSTGSVPIIDELNTGSYKAVLLMFGQNECGWPSQETFFNKYAQLLQDVWLRQPNCKIFIAGMPPVTQHVSDTNQNGLTNSNITYINGRLKSMADSTANAYYISVPSVMSDANGALPEEASGGDGIHLNPKYYKYWADHICMTVSAVIG